MSNAFKCDRCKQFKDGKPYSELSLMTLNDDDCDRQKSLCETCHLNILAMVDHNPVTGKAEPP